MKLQRWTIQIQGEEMVQAILAGGFLMVLLVCLGQLIEAEYMAGAFQSDVRLSVNAAFGV